MYEGFARYGFSQDVRRPLERPIDPLARPADIGAFTQKQHVSLSQIDHAIGAALTQGQPACFLVAGPNGTGRTSLANCILARYAECIGVNSERLMVPRLRDFDHSEIGTFKKWMTLLRNLVRQQNLDLPPELAHDFELERLSRVDRDTLGPAYQDLIARLVDVAKGAQPRRALAYCLEDVKTFKFINQAAEVFHGIATVCVFTTGDYSQFHTEVIQPFCDKFRSTRDELIQLGPVVGKDATSLVDARWRIETSVPNPFDADGIEHAFAEKARSIGRVITLLERMIIYKVKRYQRGPLYDGQRGELHFAPDEIFALVQALDN